jgi:uncharacterized protein
MLIEFRLKNFRSFRDDAVISMVASSDVTLADTNLIQTSIKATPRLLRSAGIYGANASGKSNLIRGLQLLQAFVAQSASLQPDQQLNIQPFLLDPNLKGAPAEFEVTFLVDGVRYQYGFAASAKRFESEWLIVYRSNKPQTWYQREFDAQKGIYLYDFGQNLLGQRSVWREATRPNALFLSTAVQLNSDSLRPVYDWITQSLIIIENGAEPSIEHTIRFIKEHKSTSIERFMANADIGISKIDLVERPGFVSNVKIDIATGESTIERLSDTILLPQFEHFSSKGRATFDLSDESRGSQRFFAYAGPLFEIIEKGRTLVVDELDVSLHALLVKEIVQMFHDPAGSTRGAQLIFSTHDTSLLQSGILRRDQVWLVEKDAELASSLVPLSDFAVRKDASIEKNYLAGRYGGVPILRKLAQLRV